MNVNAGLSFSGFIKRIIPFTFLLLLGSLVATKSIAQSMLSRKIRIQAQNKPLAEVLKEIEKQGGFYFSYNNNILQDDSLVSIAPRLYTVAQLLEQLFDKRYQYQERNNHLIIQPALIPQHSYISGWVVDAATGEPVSYATVYERRQLVSTMTDEKGFFHLQLKEKQTEVSIHISKVSYADTMLLLSASQLPATKISIQQISYTLDSVVINGVEQTWLARSLLSTRQKMNSLNLTNFFSGQPVQFSLTPGLGSHGKMGAQVVNKFSLNILGGYTAGVDGFELGSLFNIVKQDVQYLQIAGLFNITGGNVRGVQIGGLYNNVLKSVNGIQVAGISNIVSENTDGVQVGGIYNYTQQAKGIQIGGISNINIQSFKGIQVGGVLNRNRTSSGIQIAGLANINTRRNHGLQIAGLTNINRDETHGIQIAGLFNRSRKLKGIQIGLVNVTDTLDGYSIGLVNIVRKGYHKLSASVNDIQHLTLAYKSGNAGLYSILSVGTQLSSSQKAFSIGYGLGSDRSIAKGFYINPQLTHQYFFTGNWTSQNLLGRLELNLKYQLREKIFIYAGPAFSVLYHQPATITTGYRSTFAEGYPAISFSRNVKGWLGWNIGLDLF